MYCFGVSNHNPMQVIDFLIQAKRIDNREDVMILEAGSKAQAFIKESAVLVLEARDFHRNLKTFNSEAYKNTAVVVFASCLRIRELEGCTPLDTESESAGVVMPALALSRPSLRAGFKTPRQDIRRRDLAYLDSMVDSVKRGSLLNPLMSLIYSLPSSTHQTPVKEACVRMLYNGLSFEDTIQTLSKAHYVDLSPRVTERLRVLLTGDIGKAYVAFFKEYRSRDAAITLESLCDKHSTAPYEVRYILSVVGSGDSPNAGSKKRIQKKRGS